MTKKRGSAETPGWPEQAERIIRAGIDAVKPDRLIRSRVRRRGGILKIGEKSYDLKSFRKIYLIAFGKAAPSMAGALLEILGDWIDEGLITGRQDVVGPLKSAEHWKREHDAVSHPRLTYIPASHPLPDENSVEAGRRALEIAGKAGEGDLVFVLISGGGSSMLCLPAAGISLEEKRRVTQNLLRAGASINDLNSVRKHLSAVKGGRLAAALHPATVVSLVISDVIGDDLESIASGPTHPDSTTFETARGVMEKYKLWENAPGSVRRVLAEGINGKIPETVKKDDPVFERVSTLIVGNNRSALEAAAAAAEKIGFRSLILTTSDHGEARDAAREYVALVRSIDASPRLSPPGLSPLRLSPQRAGSLRSGVEPLCLLAGGELTVTVRGNGRGGRNTEFILAALAELRREPMEPGRDWLMASVGTDGIDGPTDAAGALITPSVLERAGRLSLDPASYLDNNDSYSFFDNAGGLIRTGPTGTNVMDLRVFLLK